MAGRGPLLGVDPLRDGTVMDDQMSNQAQFVTPSAHEQIVELQTKVGALRRDNALLLTQLARAAKCLNAVSSENQLLKTEVASLQPTGGMNQDPMRR